MQTDASLPSRGESLGLANARVRRAAARFRLAATWLPWVKGSYSWADTPVSPPRAPLSKRALRNASAHAREGTRKPAAGVLASP
jgi:hypothetical protein